MHEDQHAVEPDGEHRSDGVCPVVVGEEVFEILVAEAGAEAEGGDADAGPGELVGDADDALESYIISIGCYIHVLWG